MWYHCVRNRHTHINLSCNLVKIMPSNHIKTCIYLNVYILFSYTICKSKWKSNLAFMHHFWIHSEPQNIFLKSLSELWVVPACPQKYNDFRELWILCISHMDYFCGAFLSFLGLNSIHPISSFRIFPFVFPIGKESHMRVNNDTFLSIFGIQCIKHSQDTLKTMQSYSSSRCTGKLFAKWMQN